MANALTREQLQRLAQLGARARLEELEAERRAILRAFPGLGAHAAGKPGNGGTGQAKRGGASEPVAAGKRARRRKKMSPEQRKAASERMRQFWADRRKAAEA